MTELNLYEKCLIAGGDEEELGNAFSFVICEAGALFGVFGEDVDFEVDGVAGTQGVQVGGGVGVGDDGDGDASAAVWLRV